MRLIDYVAPLGWLASGVSAFGRHAAQHGLLQLSPSFAHEGINLYPALHPEHNANDLNHLVPQNSKELYYSQEGHRPALHGAKHAQLQANFSNPTVALEHSTHIRDVTCDSNHITVCFKTPQALATAEQTWKKQTNSGTFHLITYHVGCGDTTGQERSFFRASNPVVQGDCMTVAAEPIDEHQALEAGELSWGTYVSPHLAKREPVRGHVGLVKPQQEVVDGEGVNPTINLETDKDAVDDFFNVKVDTSEPDVNEAGLDSLVGKRDGELAKRGLFSWIVNGITSLVRSITGLINTAISNIKDVASRIVANAAFVLNLLMVPFGVPFHQEYRSDLEFDHRVSGGLLATDLGSLLAGVSDNAVLSSHGAAARIECFSCGAKGDLSFEGKLAFSISDGLTKAEVVFINNSPFIFDAILKFVVDARVFREGKYKKGFKQTVEKTLFTAPLPGTIYIPKIVTIGPALVVNAAASVYVDAHGEITAGARFSIGEGRLVLNALDGDRNEASGFHPSLEPIFNLTTASIVATADIALPVGIEVGVNVLDTWKKSVGVYSAPSIYFTAGFSTGEGKKCNNGIELRAGAKNRLYTSALGIWEYEFKELGITFYETGIGCISKSGWNATQVEPTKIDDPLTALENIFGSEQNLAPSKTFNLTDPDAILLADERLARAHRNQTVKQLPKTHGFRLIQDASQSATLVSGTDGHIYMVNNSMDYDISSPWGAMNLAENKFNFDVFGRLIYYNASRLNDKSQKGYFIPRMIEVGVANAKSMPSGVKAATLAVFKNDKNIETYGVAFNHTSPGQRDKQQLVWYPTVCQVAGRGLRLYVSRDLVDQNGRVATDDPVSEYVYNLVYEEDRERMNLGGPKSCRTVRLTSNRNSTTTVQNA